MNPPFFSFTRLCNHSILRPELETHGIKPFRAVIFSRLIRSPGLIPGGKTSHPAFFDNVEPMFERPLSYGIFSPAVLKAAGLGLFLLTAVLLVRFTSLDLLLDPDALNATIERSGAWAPAAYIGITAASICLFVPATIPVIAAGIIFGPFKGFIYVLAGCAAGASGAFLLGRGLGRDFVRSIFGARMRGYDAAIRRNGFLAVFYLRILNFPFTPLNFGLGLTSVRFRDYVLGTTLGVAVSVFVLTFLGGIFREAWISGRWDLLLSEKSLAAAGLYSLSVLLPLLIRRWMKR